MGTDLRALAGVEGALEERAEDRRFDAGPVVIVDADERIDFGGGQGDHVVVGEQSAVEPGDFDGSEVAAVGHCGEEVFEPAGQTGGVCLAVLEQIAEEAVAGSSPTSSPNMQNINFMRKWAARSGSIPFVAHAHRPVRRSDWRRRR